MAATRTRPCWGSSAARSHRLRSSPAAASSSSSSSPTTRRTGPDSPSATRSSRQVCVPDCASRDVAACIKQQHQIKKKLPEVEQKRSRCCFLHARLNVMNRLVENSQFKFNWSSARFSTGLFRHESPACTRWKIICDKYFYDISHVAGGWKHRVSVGRERQ